MSFQHFCKLLEDNNIGEHLFAELDAGLEEAGLVYCVGAIVDAAIGRYAQFYKE